MANMAIWLSKFSTAFTYFSSHSPDLINHHFVSISLIDQVVRLDCHPLLSGNPISLLYHICVSAV